MTVLVIDDDPSSVALMRHFLGKLELNVVVATDGYSGTVAAGKAPPDLIIMDYEMPAGNGRLVYERLQNLNQTAGVPVLFISGLTVEALQAAIPPHAKLRYLAKPVEYEDVVRCLRELLPDLAGPHDKSIVL